MASLRFPDTGTRMVELSNGKPAVNGRGYLYADSQLTIPAEVYRDVNGVKGALITPDDEGRVSIRLDTFGRQLDYWGPADGTDRLWIVVGGVVSVVDADYNRRIDAVEGRVTTLEGVVVVAGDVSAAVAAEAALRVSGDATSVSTAAADATTKAAAAQAAAISTASADATSKVTAHTNATDPHGDRTAAATDATTKANAAQAAAIAASAQRAANLSDLGSASTARTNLGLGGAATASVGTGAGTVAAGDDSRIVGAAQKSANLSDLGSTPTARTNLGLGAAAIRAVGTTSADVAAGDAPAAAQAAAVQRANHLGTQSADTLTDGTTNKAFLATERTKLTGIATAATANSTDAQLRDRSTHTGSQTTATITGLDSALAAKVETADAPILVRAAGSATDNTATIQSAVSATTAGQKTVQLGPGTHRVTAQLNLLSEITFEGAGEGPNGTVLLIPAASSFRVIDVDGKSNVKIRNLSVRISAGGSPFGNNAGVCIRGNSTDVLVEGVTVDGLTEGIRVAGAEGTVTGTCERISLVRSSALNAPNSFGININDADVVRIDECRGRGNWYDGFKLRKNTKNVSVVGGSYSGNGLSGQGDGADCYAGGDSFSIMGTTFKDNIGSGLTVKTGSLTQTDPGGYGYVRNVDLVGLRCTGNTNGQGLYLTVSAPEDLTQPLASNVTVTGGYFANNSNIDSTGCGIYINARNVVVQGAKVRRNQLRGITVSIRSMDVELNGIISLANGTASGTGLGIGIDGGTRIKVRGGTILGVDADTVTQESDYASLTKYHGRNISVASVASDVFIDGVNEKYCTGSQGIITAMTSGVCVINQRGTGQPNSVGAYGSIGSRFIQTDASNVHVEWQKTTLAPNAATTGWSPVMHGVANRTTLDFPSIAAGATATLTVAPGAASGVATTDAVLVQPPSTLPDGLIISGWVSGTNQVSIKLYNATAGALDPASGTWGVAVVKL